MNYVDTSVLVAAFVSESHTQRAERWLTGGSDQELAISEWTIAEFSSALAMKLRVGSIDIEARTAALEALAILMQQSLIVFPVTGAHFRIAARYADQHALGLRAPDALHLAISSGQSATLCTFDKRLVAAGRALGLAMRLV